MSDTNKNLVYMDCPICGELFSYIEQPEPENGPPVFITCTKCTCKFPQPKVDPYNMFEAVDRFSGATTAPVDAGNILDTFEELMNTPPEVEK